MTYGVSLSVGAMGNQQVRLLIHKYYNILHKQSQALYFSNKLQRLSREGVHTSVWKWEIS